MDKETIKSYLVDVRDLMRRGRFIQAYEELGFVLKNFGKAKEDLRKR